MANQDKPAGLTPHGRLLRSRIYVAGSTVYPGDAVTLATDGQVDAASTGILIGVAMHKATSGQNVVIADDPNQLFEVQADDALAVTDVGLNAALQGHGSPNTTYNRSGMELDSSTAAATATLAVQILGFSTEANNTANAANNNVIVRINTHQLGTLGVLGI